ncbi:MAG: aldehyde dehydrogenase family protein [Hyphomicrobiaceae bacterium]|nr:aldehyde dehydrogenase family protein [Hyphomicrobiaceae bacterium]
MSEIICISPVDGREVARRQTAGGEEIERAFAAARTAQREWSRVPVPERAAAMLRFLEAMRAMNPDITRELALQMGRPVRYGGELISFAERVTYMAGIAEAALAPIVPEPNAGSTRYVRRDPLGLVLVVAPWNYPYLTAVNTVVPALIAGNAVVLKTASQTILTGERFQNAFDRIGLPTGLFQNLVLGHEDTARILGAGAVDHVTFTGSVGGGRAIERAAAGTFTSVALELGGKDPAYVRADAKLDHAVENLVDGAFFNSGQSCCGVERIYVDERVHDRFVEGFTALTRQYVLDDPLEESTTLGPMAATRFADVVREQTAEAVEKGARTHIDPATFKRDEDDTPWLAPQVLTGVDHGMQVMTEESFGPVVGIMKVASDAEAIRLMNDSRYGLTASVWTTDLAAAEAIGGEIETGTVYMNRCDYLDPALAWSGVKDTGRGAGLSRIGYEMLTRPKSFHLREV